MKLTRILTDELSASDRWRFCCVIACVLFAAIGCSRPPRATGPVGDPSLVISEIEITARDQPWDNGESVQLTLFLPELGDRTITPTSFSGRLILQQSEEANGLYHEIASFPPDDGSWKFAEGELIRRVGDCVSGHPYFFRVAYAADDEAEPQILARTATAAVPSRDWFLGDKLILALVGTVICGAVILFIRLAKAGLELKVRRIAGLEAVDEAIGRATEMGRSVLFVPGIQDMNDIQTIAGLNILSHVAKVSAEYDAEVEVPTSRALVMTAARETLQGSYLMAGRPEGYNPDAAYYVTDEQFGYVAYVSGQMVREEPAACFYLGAFFAESLILAETGNAVGAIQVAGTAQPSQLPFFVAACDYTLIGEELFAASAYLSGSPEELGSLKGQDVGKLLVAVSLVLGSLWVTCKPYLADWGVI